MTHQKFDIDTTIAALLYLTHKASGKIDLYALVKLMYFADKEHFHNWAHTITGDTFARLPHGSTGSNTLDILSAARGDRKRTKEDIKFAQRFFKIEKKDAVIALENPNMDVLSKAEVKTLEAIYQQHGDKSFKELKALAHDKAYKKSLDHFMTYKDLAEDNEELLDHLGL